MSENETHEISTLLFSLKVRYSTDEASILKSIGEMVETMIDDGEEGGGKVKLKVGKTEKQQGSGGKMKIEALKKGKQVEIGIGYDRDNGKGAMERVKDARIRDLS